MQWASEWWGIILIAEDKEDRIFLQDLQSKLSEKPKVYSYEDGEIEIESDEDNFHLIFNR